MNATTDTARRDSENQMLPPGQPGNPPSDGQEKGPIPLDSAVAGAGRAQEPSHSARRNAEPVKGGAGKWIFLLVILAVGLAGFLLWKRSGEGRQLAAETRELAVLTVPVVHPSAGPTQNEVMLPGNLMAYTEASIYARTSGYLKAWHTDIGAKVQEGQVMAEIDAPDVDAQLRQTNAALAQAKANLEIANLNFDRQKDLLQKKVASQQEYDQNRTNVAAMQAAVQAGEANVQNLKVQQDFQALKAPFPGVVTKRNTDVGALITAQNGTGQELFRVARTDILRVYVYVPQAYAAYIKEGARAYLDFTEFPGEKFEGKVAHIAGAIDPATRTLQTQIEVENKDGRLFPGSFANTHLSLPLKKAPTVIPVNTLLFRSEGTQVAAVGEDNIVHLKKVTIGQDYGTTLEVTNGVSPEDWIILNPSDSLAEGAVVRVQKPTPPKGK